MIELRTDRTMIITTSSTTRKIMMLECVLSLYPNIRVSVLEQKDYYENMRIYRCFENLTFGSS